MVFKYTHVNQFEFSEGYRPLLEEFLAHIKSAGLQTVPLIVFEKSCADLKDICSTEILAD